METVTVSRRMNTPAATVRAAMRDLEGFMRAAGFDEVTVEDRRVEIANTVGLLLRIQLDLEVVDDPEAALAYEQREGPFREMATRYHVDRADIGTEVSATTEFELDVAAVGMVLDATVVRRQRRAELTRQFDYLAALADGM